jgi:hypothetical protein
MLGMAGERRPDRFDDLPSRLVELVLGRRSLDEMIHEPLD